MLLWSKQCSALHAALAFVAASVHLKQAVLPIFYDNSCAADLAAARVRPQQPSCIADALQYVAYEIALCTNPVFVHVSSHSGVYYNEYVDSLAKAGAKGDVQSRLPILKRDNVAADRGNVAGLAKLIDFNRKNPLPWTANWLSSAGMQVAPQETEVESYIIGGLKQDVDDKTFENFEL